MNDRDPDERPAAYTSPAVDFDRDGYRLGDGGGFFDRTLAAMPAKPLVFDVGYSRWVLPTIFPQPHDIPMDLIVTEVGVLPGAASASSTPGAS